MVFKSCINCSRLVLYLLHVTSGAECCTTFANSPNLEQLRQIELSADHTIDPCDDFYGHACNNWAEHHTDGSYDEITGLVDNKVNTCLQQIIESSSYEHSQPVASHAVTFVEKLRSYYISCRDEKSRNVKLYFDAIKPSATLEWPLLLELQAALRNEENFQLPEWPNQEWNLFSLLGRLQSYGFNNVLISQEVARARNGSLQIMLELPYATEADEIPPHVFMVLLVGMGLPDTTAARYARRLIRTQERWHDVYQNFSQTAGSADNRLKLTYLELSEQIPELTSYLENLLPQQIQPTDYVVIANYDYFQFLLNKSWLPKEPINLTNYLMMKFIAYLIQDSTSEFTPLACIKDVRNKMDLAVNFIYYENVYLHSGARLNTDVFQLYQNIEEYFLKLLRKNHLNLEDDELQRLQEKLLSLTLNIGNFPKHLNVLQVEEFYKDVPALSDHNYYSNQLSLLQHRFQKSLLYPQNQTFFVANDNRVGSSSAPIYILKQHMAILPLGFLQTPIYDHAFDPLFTWSLLGFLLAHEFAHAIDTMGLLYSKDGHMLAQDPSIFSNSNFTSALECMQRQEPTDSIDERLVDIVGARVVFEAYVNLHQWSPQPYFTNIPWKKLFFLNMAQFFCGRKNVKFVDHDSDAVRLRQIVKNFEGFADAFQCPTGSPMNPVEKCRLY